MRRNRKIASIAFTGVAAIGAVGLGAGPALAAGGAWTINEPNGTNFTGTNSSPATLTAAGVPLTCADGTAVAHGTVSGNGKSGVPASLAAISAATFGTTTSPCSVLGNGVTAKLTHGTHLVASNATNTSGVTKGYIGSNPKVTDGISASINGVNGFSCHMVVTGTYVSGSYHNTGNFLKIGPGGDLTIKSVTGCLGVFAAGESAGFTAKYNTSPKLTVSGG
jgi:hypothetical protein